VCEGARLSKVSQESDFGLPWILRWGAVRVEGGGSEDEIANLYRRARPALLAYAYRLVGSFPDAEDLVQIAFLRLHIDFEKKTEITNLRKWLYRVVHNLAVDQLRREGKRDWLVRAWRSDAREPLRAHPVEDELLQRQLIERALGQLNERERYCLLLRAEGLSYREIGDVLEISEKAVSVYLARGLAKFEPAYDEA